MSRKLFICAALSILTLAAGCGGGSSSSEPTAVVTGIYNPEGTRLTTLDYDQTTLTTYKKINSRVVLILLKGRNFKKGMREYLARSPRAATT